MTEQEQAAPSTKRRSERNGSSDSSRQETQATMLLGLTESAGVQLYHSAGADPDGYASVPIEGHRETWRIGAKMFRYWLQRLFWQQHKSAVNAQALQDVIGVLRGQAMFEGAERPVFVRLAEFEGAIWLDLANEDWQAVRIDHQGWTVVNEPPVRFVRPRGMLPLPIPEPGGSIDDLRPFVNVGDDADWLLVVSWLVATLRPNGPFPLLGIHGEQGSAKSTTCRMLRALVDPNEAALRSEPRDERDLMIAASNGWVVALENLSKVPIWLSDALCRLATGGGFGTRELYSDGEEKLFNAKRPVMLNGITELATRPDLLDRSILINLPRISDDRRCTEAELWRDFDAAKPRILGAVLDAVSMALRNLDSVVLECKPRMADFAQWGCAAEPAFGCEPGAFMVSYRGNRETANESAIESSIIAGPLLAMLNGCDKWEGTATELKAALEDAAGDRATKDRGWPKRPHILSGELKRIAPNLRRMGFDVDIGKSGPRFVHIRRLSQASVPSVPSVQQRGNGHSEASAKRPDASKPTGKTTSESAPLDATDAVDAESSERSACDHQNPGTWQHRDGKAYCPGCDKFMGRVT